MPLPKQIANLLFKHIRDELNDQEQLELNAWKVSSPENEVLFKKLTDADSVRELMRDFYSYKERTWEKLLDKAPELSPTPAVHKFKWQNLAVAASILILLGAAVFVGMILNKRTTNQQIAKTKSATSVDDIHPGSNRAVLTLANGSKIILDKANPSETIKLSGNNIEQLDSADLHYSLGRSGNSKEEIFNSLTTPRGGQFHLVLPDGTNVWLNAASSIKYPIAFKSDKREVKIDGEVYFEVVKDANAPFIVKVRDAEVRVLGTHFNINSYADERVTSITLLEGSIRVVEGTNSKTIQPGEQAQLLNKDSTGIEIFRHVEVEQAVAWKNGRIFFKDADVPSIMRMISRWYDVDVVYQGEIPKRNITGAISRNADLSDLLKVLELNRIHFIINGRKMTITP